MSTQRGTAWVSAASAAVTLGGMIATPLASRGGTVRRALSSVVVCGLASSTSVAARRRWGGRRAGAAGSAVVVGTALIERLGSRRGVPFGRYAYTGALRPQLGGVPAIVPLAWWAMALPARETASAALGSSSRRGSRVVAGAAALTAWDLFLDPQMVGEGYWRWARPRGYRGIPATNFAGWFVTGLGVMAVLELLLPPERAVASAASSPPAPSADPVLVGQYATMAAMETLGFAVFFRDRVVAAVGGMGMLPVAVAATSRLLRTRAARRG